MSKSAKGSLIHGIINVMLQIVVVLIHSGAIYWRFANAYCLSLYKRV